LDTKFDGLIVGEYLPWIGASFEAEGQEPLCDSAAPVGAETLAVSERALLVEPLPAAINAMIAPDATNTVETTLRLPRCGVLIAIPFVE